MKKENHKPFIPRDKPKSWVLFLVFCMSGLLIAGPTMFLGIYFKINIIDKIGSLLFTLCWIAGVASWFVFVVGMITGKYRNIKEQEWSKQLW